VAYAELYFTEVLWPEFDKEQLEQAFDWYQTRERRFGRVDEKISPANGDA
jgi:undecaprenyl diphosphate synthase